MSQLTTHAILPLAPPRAEAATTATTPAVRRTPGMPLLVTICVACATILVSMLVHGFRTGVL